MARRYFTTAANVRKWDQEDYDEALFQMKVDALISNGDTNGGNQ